LLLLLSLFLSCDDTGGVRAGNDARASTMP
jgi:hypothetical protein